MFDTDYNIAWTVYLCGAFGGVLVWWRMTRWMWRLLWEPLWLLVAVIAFTPTLVDPSRDLHAPAIAITVMDLLFEMGNNAWRAVSDLVFYALIALGLYIPFALLRWLIMSRFAQTSAEDAESEQASEDELLGQRRAEPSGHTQDRDTYGIYGVERNRYSDSNLNQR